ncbi:phosphoribosylglycinamide formyltransferase [Tenuifilaceae bacterium CYCD]|nr:phosphoribosylglycinamide formyltransferase [Tenuifilaceae bacterium CYCD]
MNNIAILASGSGSNAENIALYFKDNLDVKISLIATENPSAFVIDRAKKLNIEWKIFTMEELKNGSLLNMLKSLNIDFIVLAGFLKLIPENLISAYANRIINIHPALLPEYGGKGMYGNKVHEAVIANKESESGITIHYVNSKYDEGGIIFQAKCAITPKDNAETLAQKVHSLEYEYYPKVIESLVAKHL